MHLVNSVLHTARNKEENQWMITNDDDDYFFLKHFPSLCLCGSVSLHQKRWSWLACSNVVGTQEDAAFCKIKSKQDRSSWEYQTHLFSLLLHEQGGGDTWATDQTLCNCDYCQNIEL